jgi:hypothetical protein
LGLGVIGLPRELGLLPALLGVWGLRGRLLPALLRVWRLPWELGLLPRLLGIRMLPTLGVGLFAAGLPPALVPTLVPALFRMRLSGKLSRVLLRRLAGIGAGLFRFRGIAQEGAFPAAFCATAWCSRSRGRSMDAMKISL